MFPLAKINKVRYCWLLKIKIELMHMTAQAANLITNVDEQHNYMLINIIYKIQPASESSADLDITLKHRLWIYYFTTHHHQFAAFSRKLASLPFA